MTHVLAMSDIDTGGVVLPGETVKCVEGRLGPGLVRWGDGEEKKVRVSVPGVRRVKPGERVWVDFSRKRVCSNKGLLH